MSSSSFKKRKKNRLLIKKKLFELFIKNLSLVLYSINNNGEKQ